MTQPRTITVELDQSEISTLLQALATQQLQAQVLQNKLVDSVNAAMAPKPGMPGSPDVVATEPYPPDPGA